MKGLETPLLKEVNLPVLIGLPLVKDAYQKAEGEFAVVLQDDTHITLTNRRFEMVDELLGHFISGTLDEKLDSGSEIVVGDLGGGYLSQTDLDILGLYSDPNLTIYNVDLFAQTPDKKDDRLHIVKGDFRTLPLEGMFDIIYSWQLLEKLNKGEETAIGLYRKIAGMLKPEGEAFIDDPNLVEVLGSDVQAQDRFKRETGILTLQFPMGYHERKEFRKFVYIARP